MISLDITLIIQMINFIVTLFLINFLLVSPIRRIINKRNQIIQTGQAEANALFESAAGLLSDYETRLDNARKAAAQLRAEQQQKARQEEHALVEQAHQDAQAYLDATRTQLQKEAAKAREQLGKQVNKLAKMAVAKMLN